MTAQTFTQFATVKAQAGLFADIADIRNHYGNNYAVWLDTTLNEYRNYLADNFPSMTLAQARELTAAE